jgi:hypothetical protein
MIEWKERHDNHQDGNISGNRKIPITFLSEVFQRLSVDSVCTASQSPR